MRFDSPGKENTEKTLALAHARAKELGIREVVVASTSGETGLMALKVFEGFSVAVVTYHAGFRKPFETVMPAEARKELIARGATVVQATHALSGVERSFAKKFSGAYPVLVMAEVLRLFGQGLKVAVEVSIMAADSGALSGADIISIGGTARGADCALVLKPANQSDVLDLKVREIICKPREF
ncbi:MAG: pyruvate kinase alpha/beta domain-containing protein [Thermodesulfobacteriota bacterium]